MVDGGVGRHPLMSLCDIKVCRIATFYHDAMRINKVGDVLVWRSWRFRVIRRSDGGFLYRQKIVVMKDGKIPTILPIAEMRMDA